MAFRRASFSHFTEPAVSVVFHAKTGSSPRRRERRLTPLPSSDFHAAQRITDMNRLQIPCIAHHTLCKTPCFHRTKACFFLLLSCSIFLIKLSSTFPTSFSISLMRKRRSTSIALFRKKSVGTRLPPPRRSCAARLSGFSLFFRTRPCALPGDNVFFVVSPLSSEGDGS